MKAKGFFILVFFFLLSIVGLIVIFTEIHILQHSRPQATGTASINSGNRPVLEASSRSSVSRAAFVFLGLGAQAYQMNCPAAIESLVRYGGWNGEVYLVTDRATCFNEKEIVEAAGMDESKFHLAVVEEDFGGGGFDIKHMNSFFTRNRMRSKSMKTRLFDIVADPNIDVIGYVDCDVLFGIPGCPTEFLNSIEPWEQRNIQFKRIKLDSSGDLIGLHTGTMVVHRQHSKDALRRWREELDRGDYALDRLPYLHAYQKLQEELERNISADKLHDVRKASTVRRNLLDDRNPPLQQLRHQEVGQQQQHQQQQQQQEEKDNKRPHNPMLPGQILRTLNGTKTMFERFVRAGVDTVHCINHISKAQCDIQGTGGIQQFVDRFQLRSYAGGYPYCPSRLLAPLLYGWFPFSYLPFCPKIEHYS